VSIADDDVTAGKHLKRRNPRELDPGQFVLLDAPDDLAVGCDLDDPVAVAAANQRVAADQPQRRKYLGAVPFGAVAGRARATGKVESVTPDDLAFTVVFANDAVPFVTDEIVSAGQLASQPRIAVRLRVFDVQRNFLNELSIPIDLNETPVAAF